MTTPRRPGFVLPVAVTLAVLLGLYVGAYYGSVDRVVWGQRSDDGPWKVISIEIDYHVPESLDGFAERFFSPIRWLGRRIHPDVWELT